MITETLLHWYDQNKRDLPWRDIHDPYRTWVSEIMLQQTRVDTVMEYYKRFISIFPDIDSLAGASEDEVLKLWEGLGYYSRARNLHKGARQVVSEFDGIIPSDPMQLKKIHGIGEYTAGAIASIAYNIPAIAVDGNVIRVISRLFGIRDNMSKPEVRDELEKKLMTILSRERPGDFNQALMDLGATICTPGTPDCDTCPLQKYCDAFSTGDASDLPVLPKAKPLKETEFDVLLIYSGDQILITKRTGKLLQGLYVFPMIEGYRSDPVLELKHRFGLEAETFRIEGYGRHVFTHLVWNMRIVSFVVRAARPVPSGYFFVPITELGSLSFPVAMKKARSLIAPGHP